MLTFYNHRGVRITDHWVVIDGRRYPVRGLSGVRTSRGPINRMAVRALGVGGSMFAVALLLGPVLPVPMTAALGLVGLGALGTGFVATRLQPREQMLWIDVQGSELMLISTRDAIEMGKVRRALRRAIERDAQFLRNHGLGNPGLASQHRLSGRLVSF
jgi:hypothetical protein